MRVPVYNPLIEDVDIDAVSSALKQRWMGQGKLVEEFEQEAARLIGHPERFVVAVSNGTSAIHLSLLAAGVRRGDEVIMSSLNFVGVAQAVVSVGAMPVFCDVSDTTLTMDVSTLEKGITKKTAVIIALDYATNRCALDDILDVAKQHKIRVIHDAAHSFGWKDQGRVTGSFGDITVFSFDPVKNFSAIDAGLIVVNTKQEDRWLREARSVGQKLDFSTDGKDAKMEFREVTHVGFRYHLSNIHAALGLSQLNKFTEIEESRRWACQTYTESLKEFHIKIKPISTCFDDVIPFIYVVREKSNQREALRQFLAKNGVETHVHWRPIHRYEFFRDARTIGNLDITEAVGMEVLTLPLHSRMPKREIEYVIEKIQEFYSG